MSNITDVVGITANLFTGEGGLLTNLDALNVSAGAPAPALPAPQIVTQNVPVEIAEKRAVRYPTVQIYCERAINQMQEKFRSFSGRIDLVVEIRASSDRVETLDVEINLMVDAVVRTLDQNRGDWGSGVLFGGAYEVAFGPVKQGGKNYLQTAKVTFSVEVSRA